MILHDEIKIIIASTCCSSITAVVPPSPRSMGQSVGTQRKQ